MCSQQIGHTMHVLHQITLGYHYVCYKTLHFFFGGGGGILNEFCHICKSYATNQLQEVQANVVPLLKLGLISLSERYQISYARHECCMNHQGHSYHYTCTQ